MKFCIVEIKTQTATFRNPEFQNFHKTLMLPPPTTMIGLAGAALGLSPKSSQDFFDEDDFKIGVCGSRLGITKDLWKYNDFKNGSIMLREIMFHNHFVCVYGSENLDKIQRIGEAFINPTFALSMGSSDSLAKISRVRFTSQTYFSKDIDECILEGDIVAEVMDKAAIDPIFSIYSTSEPIAMDIPTRFNYKDDYGIRNVVKRKTLSFITKPMKLNIEKEGVPYDDYFIPVFDL